MVQSSLNMEANVSLLWEMHFAKEWCREVKVYEQDTE